MIILDRYDVGDGFEIRRVNLSEFRPLFMELRPKLFSKTLDFSAEESFSSLEKEQVEKLNARSGNSFSCALLLYQNEEIVGWSFGRQENSEKFYHVNSAVFPEYRNRGFYKKLLIKLVDIVSQEGFQIIYSRHTMTNSAIIVPKLKCGFIISGFELSDRFGTLVHLSFFKNPLRRKVMDFRAGELVPDEDIKRLFKI